MHIYVVEFLNLSDKKEKSYRRSEIKNRWLFKNKNSSLGIRLLKKISNAKSQQRITTAFERETLWPKGFVSNKVIFKA